jgi:hypothetical protein
MRAAVGPSDAAASEMRLIVSPDATLSGLPCRAMLIAIDPMAPRSVLQLCSKAL